MAAKPRRNIRFRADLWDALVSRAKRRQTNVTVELEAAAEHYLVAEGELTIVAPMAGEPSRVEPSNGAAVTRRSGLGGRVVSSSQNKAGVRPIPKGAKR